MYKKEGGRVSTLGEQIGFGRRGGGVQVFTLDESWSLKFLAKEEEEAEGKPQLHRPTKVEMQVKDNGNKAMEIKLYGVSIGMHYI